MNKKVLQMGALTVLMGVMQAQAAIVISTTDGTGGVSGFVENGGDVGFGGTDWWVKNYSDQHPSDGTRKGYVRIDTSLIDFTATDASLNLTIAEEALTDAQSSTIYVYGITNQSLDSVALDATTTWANAPANDTGSYYAADTSNAMLLGTFVVSGSTDSEGTAKTFSSAALTTFLNDDSNGVVTFLLGNGGENIANLKFVGDTHATYAAPSLTVIPEPSSYALLAGCFGLTWVMLRRRR